MKEAFSFQFMQYSTQHFIKKFA